MVFSGVWPDAPRCAITQGLRMFAAILADSPGVTALPLPARCRIANHAPHANPRGR
jgi:hypothetical protein